MSSPFQFIWSLGSYIWAGNGFRRGDRTVWTSDWYCHWGIERSCDRCRFPWGSDGSSSTSVCVSTSEGGA